MQPVRFLDSAAVPRSLAAFPRALDRAGPLPSELLRHGAAMGEAARRGERLGKESLLDLAALLLGTADALRRDGRAVDALVLEGLEGLVVELLVTPA